MDPAMMMALGVFLQEFRQDDTWATPLAVASAHRGACEAGYLPSCQAIAWGAVGDDGFARSDLGKAGDALASACEGADPVACLVVGWSRAAAGDVGGASSAWRASCELGVGRACGELGRVAVDEAEARGLFDRGCDGSDGFSCLQVANGLDVARWAAISDGESRGYLDRACAFGSQPGCVALGIELLAGAPDEVSRAEDLFRLACDAGHAAGCSQAAALWGLGGARPHPEPMVRALRERACALGDVSACPLVSPAVEEVDLASTTGASADDVAGWVRFLEDYGLFLAIGLAPLFLANAAWQMYRSFLQHQALTAAWGAAARDAGLTASGVWPKVEMRGNIAGVEVSVRHWSEKGGKNSRPRYYVRADAVLTGMPDDLVVYPARWYHTFGALVGLQDVVIGERAFDDRFVVKALDEGEARRTLDGPLRAALLRELDALGHVAIEKGRLVHHGDGPIPVARAVELALTLATDAAAR